MTTAITFLLLWAWMSYKEAQYKSGLHWYEIKGVTKFLLLGEMPVKRKCRACDQPLPDDTILHVELSPGVYVHEECSEPILLEAQLTYPDWFEQPMPELPPEEPKQIEEAKPEVRYYTCALCSEKHQMDQICMKEMVRVLTCEKCDKITCVCEVVGPKFPPADVGDWLRDIDMERTFGGTGGNGGDGKVVYVRKDPYHSELVVQNPRMNTIVIDPLAPPSYTTPHNCTYCGTYIMYKGLCSKCIMWGAPSMEPCGQCTYYHESGTNHPDVFCKYRDAGKLSDFVERRVREGYHPAQRFGRW